MHKLAPFLLVPVLLLLPGCGSAEEANAGGQPGAAQEEHAGDVHEHHNHDIAPVAAAKSADFTVIDVRTPAEFKKGHLARAKNIDINAKDFDSKVAALPREGEYLVYCQSGARSSMAKARMDSQGFETVVDGGGFEELINGGAPKA